MARTIPLFTAILISCTSLAQAPQTITYQWLNQPCNEMLQCDQGCSACNMPAGGTSALFGTNMAWIGVSTCPLPLTPGDNAVMTTGWSMEPGNDHYLIFSGIAMAPMTIDSLIIDHTSATNGPTRLKVEYTGNAAAAFEEVADVAVPPSLAEQSFIELGTIEVPEGAAMGIFQVRITPYDGFGEGWAVNEIRVVATPVQAGGVGITEVFNNRTTKLKGPWVDVLGRPIGADPAPGVYQGPTRRIGIF